MLLRLPLDIETHPALQPPLLQLPPFIARRERERARERVRERGGERERERERERVRESERAIYPHYINHMAKCYCAQLSKTAP